MKALRALVLAMAIALPGTAGSAPAPDDGFTPLLDRSLDGWTVENTTPEKFSLTDGVLRTEGPDGWLRSPKRYGNFRLRFEFRFLAENSDSGVFLRAAGTGLFMRGWPNESYQVQLLKPTDPTARFPGVGGLFRHGRPPGETRFDRADAQRLAKGVGDWQTLEVEAVGSKVTIWFNGQLLSVSEGVDPAPGFIGFQGEVGQVEYRDIRIKEL